MAPGRSFTFLTLLALFAVSGARAVVGPAHDGAAFSDRVVMVLTRGGEGSAFCTGIVLSPRIVLTAAHCLRPAADMAVHYRDAAGQPVVIAVAVAAAFQPAALAEGDAPSIGQAATVVGYGLGQEGRPKTGGALRAAALRVREPASKILLWASDPEDGGAGACSGDSGAPIFAEDAKTVLAIVAWTSGGKGHKCGALTQGPLIAPLREWIDSVRSRWSP